MIHNTENKTLAKYFNYRRLTDAKLEFYDQNGYLVIDRILTASGLKRIEVECMRAWHDEKDEFDSEKTWLQNALLRNIHHKALLARDYYFDGPLVGIAEQIIGPDIKGVTSQLTFKMRGNTKPFHWHQDNAYGELDPYNSITCLTAFDDTDQSNGCLWIIPQSHKQGQQAGLSLAEKRNQAEIKVDADETNAIPMPMTAGQCLIFNCWMLHKSDGNFSNDRDRRVLFLRYADADAVEVYNDRKPRLGRLLRGTTRFPEVAAFETDL